MVRWGADATAPPLDPSTLGMHAASLLLRAGLFDGDALAAQRAVVVAYVKAQLEGMFPINADAPRLSSPSQRSASGFYTPYFATFTFAGLLRAGEADWVLEQYRQAWGWALAQSPTWLEVFDVRWEMVHSWGGCPTWQLSQFMLGLSPRLDVGERHFALELHVGTRLPACSGTVPARAGDPIAVSWTRAGGADGVAVDYTLTLSIPASVLGWPTAPTAWTLLDTGAHTVRVEGCQ